MLKQFKSLIYKNEEEEKQVFEEIIDFVQKENPDYTRTEIYDSVMNNKADKPDYDFLYESLTTEGSKLFELTVSEFGNKLWNRKVLPLKTCERKCPVGGVCDKFYVKIDGERFCYGQLFLKKINVKGLQEIAKKQKVQIFDENKKLLFDLNSDYDEQYLYALFFKYEYFILWFGDNDNHNLKRINGNNVIRFLLHSNQNG